MTKDKALSTLNSLKIMHPDAGCELSYTTPFELLVAVILSAQCTDKRVNMATEQLFKVYNTPEQFASLAIDQLKPYIFSCGFYNNKGSNIIAMAKELVAKYHSEVPKTLEELITLPGVGRKTASVVLSVAYDIPAMPVDTHVFRVSGRLGLSRAKTVEGVERDLMALYPQDQWNILHHSLIFFGRYTCKSQRPECNKCLLQAQCQKDKG